MLLHRPGALSSGTVHDYLAPGAQCMAWEILPVVPMPRPTTLPSARGADAPPTHQCPVHGRRRVGRRTSSVGRGRGRHELLIGRQRRIRGALHEAPPGPAAAGAWRWGVPGRVLVGLVRGGGVAVGGLGGGAGLRLQVGLGGGGVREAGRHGEQEVVGKGLRWLVHGRKRERRETTINVQD